MFLTNTENPNIENERVYFSDLSETAQEKALAHTNVDSPAMNNWDVFPLEYLAESKLDMSQDEIDLAGLTGIGAY
ncbi:MAG: hypothetical protein COB67_02295 [SAR324 cluster bacterium]|uniref:Uncharacterized protein n=1 Tax=SAR324 cluster bacterium TaxID=2024889 RepID=A0A2A4T929_9DELT|nr:MAG: hypothetical protein COB67_02295 [SAR324 cluster bacterium]